MILAFFAPTSEPLVEGQPRQSMFVTQLSRLGMTFVVMLIVMLGGAAHAQAATYKDSEVINGFYKTVFGSEIKALSWGSQTNRVKKYVQPVKIWIINRAKKNRRKMVQGFIRDLRRTIPNLDIRFARNRKDANFRVFIVDGADYVRTVQDEIFRNPNVKVPGNCIVRVLSRRSGILGSDAVLVSDRGNANFRRCMVEEILQGLGPVNDDKSLRYSVFNDYSNYDYFTRYDKLLLNMLYNPEVKPGMTRRQIRQLAPSLLRYARWIVNRGQ